MFGAARPMVEADMPPTRRRYASKWLTLVLCEAVMMSSGTLYLFPVYSPTLKRTLDLTQEQLNFVGSAAHFGAFFSVFGGLFFDAFGARATLALGGSLKLVGLGMLYGIIAGFAPQSHVFAAFCAWVFGTGCSTSLTAALGANYATFKDRAMHGRLVGLLLSFFGLSSGIMSLLYDVFFTDPAAFVRFLAILAGGVDLCASSVVGAPKHLALPPEETLGGSAAGGGAGAAFPKRGNRASWLLSTEAFFAPASAETKLARGQAATAATAAATAGAGAALYASGSSSSVAVACLLGLFLMLGAQAGTLLAGSGRAMYSRQDMESVDATGGEEAKHAAARGARAVGPGGLFFSLDFYLLFFALMLGLGSGITVINNLSQMVSAYPSLADAADPKSAGGFLHGLIKLLACANTLGRLASGSASDALRARRRDATTRAEFTTWCLALMGVGMTLLLLVPDATPALPLVLGVAVVGWAFGALFWAMPTLTMELFGAARFGANRGVVGLSPAIGGYLLSTKVAGRVYAAAASESSGAMSGSNACVAGGACYRNAWGINLACTALATLACAALARRDKRRAATAAAEATPR